jgi:hypothetical protein
MLLSLVVTLATSKLELDFLGARSQTMLVIGEVILLNLNSTIYHTHATINRSHLSQKRHLAGLATYLDTMKMN